MIFLNFFQKRTTIPTKPIFLLSQNKKYDSLDRFYNHCSHFRGIYLSGI